MRFAFIICTNW